MSFYSPQDTSKQLSIKLRSTNLYQAKHGAYIGICDDDKQKVFIVLGTKADPVTAPLGIKRFADSTNVTDEYSLLSIALNDETLHNFVDELDSKVLSALAVASQDIFHEKYTAQELMKMKYYLPMLYDAKNGLDPLLGAKLADNCMVLDNEMSPTNDDISPGAQVCCVFSLPSLYFKAPNSCRMTVRCEKIMIIENGQDAKKAVNDFQFT